MYLFDYELTKFIHQMKSKTGSQPKHIPKSLWFSLFKSLDTRVCNHSEMSETEIEKVNDYFKIWWSHFESDSAEITRTYNDIIYHMLYICEVFQILDTQNSAKAQQFLSKFSIEYFKRIK